MKLIQLIGVALCLVSSSLRAQSVTARNDSATASDQWVVVSTPNIPGLPRQAEFAGGPAVRLFSCKGATFYGIRPALDANSVATDTFALTEQEHAFVEHPNVFDNLFDLAPELFIDGRPIPKRFSRLVESNAARRVYQFSYREPGWQGEAWLTIWSDQPTVDFSCLVSWSDREDARWSIPTNVIQWRFGEMIHVPTATAEGLTVAQDWKGAGILRWDVPSTKNGKVLGDAEIYRFRGSMLCAKRNQTGNIVGDLPEPPKRVSAVSRDWAGHWGPFRAVPPIPHGGQAEAQRQADEFDAILQTASTMFTVERPYAHQNRAGNAGRQEVFGHSPAGIAVSLYDPRQIERLQFSVSDDFMRPEHLRTSWGGTIGFDTHPELATWNMRPHWGRSRTNGERTKPTDQWPPMYSLGDDRTNGRTGRDNEHWASMVPATFLLTGERDLLHIMYGWASVLPTNNNVWNTNSRLVDRALGRVLRLCAWMDLCFGGQVGQTNHETIATLVDRADALMKREGPVKHMGDLTYDQRGLVNEGQPVATINVPFQSLAACGLFAASLALPESFPQKAKARELALELGESIVLYELYEENGRAWAPYHLHYRDDGQPIPDAERVSGNWEVKDGAPSGQGTDWLATWAYGVLPIVAEESDNASAVSRAVRLMGTIPAASSWFDARFRGTREGN